MKCQKKDQNHPLSHSDDDSLVTNSTVSPPKESLLHRFRYVPFIIVLIIVIIYIIATKLGSYQISYHNDDSLDHKTITDDPKPETDLKQDDAEKTIVPTVVYNRDAVTVTAQNLVEKADEFLLFLDISNAQAIPININIDQLFINDCQLSKPLTIAVSANKTITGQITIAKEKLKEYDLSAINLIDIGISVSSTNEKDNPESKIVSISTIKSEPNSNQDFINGKNIYNKNNLKINAKPCQNGYCFRVSNNNKNTYAVILKRIKINGTEQKSASLIEVKYHRKGLIKYQPIKATDKIAVEFIIYENEHNNYASTGLLKIN